MHALSTGLSFAENTSFLFLSYQRYDLRLSLVIQWGGDLVQICAVQKVGKMDNKEKKNKIRGSSLIQIVPVTVTPVPPSPSTGAHQHCNRPAGPLSAIRRRRTVMDRAVAGALDLGAQTCRSLTRSGSVLMYNLFYQIFQNFFYL